MKILNMLVVMVLAGLLVAAAQADDSVYGQWYDESQPGHGIVVQPVGGDYTAQWYFHDGDQAWWVVTDVCAPEETCPAWTARAQAFPAAVSKLVDAGTVTLSRSGEYLLLEFDLQITEVGCWSLPGPFPAQCIGNDGKPDRARIYQPGLSQTGAYELDLLVPWQ